LDRLPADAVVVVFEKDEELAAHCQGAWEAHLGPRARDPRLFVLTEDREAAVAALFRRLPLGRLRRCEFLPLAGSWLAHAPRYRQVFERFEAGLARWWANRITCLHMGPLWIRNLVDNLRDQHGGWEPWPDWGRDPVLVCGAGVTLEEALPWARDHRDRIRLLAADTALPVLKAWDLVPDAVVCLEAQHANLADFAGWVGVETNLFTDLTSFPPGTRVFSGPTRWFITEFAELEVWGRWPWTEAEVPRLPPLGSVGVAGAWLAWRLSRGPVVLAGLDFSYPPGRTHARGAPALTQVLTRTDRFRGVEQIGTWARPALKPARGGWLTSSVMEGYAAVLADRARAEAHRTFTWSPAGLDLGLALWDPAGALGPRSTPGPATSPAPGPGAPPPPGVASPSAPGWLAAEEPLWRRALELSTAPDPRAVWDELGPMARSLDYLSFSFPDPEPRPDPDWILRFQVQLRWVIGRALRGGDGEPGAPHGG